MSRQISLDELRAHGLRDRIEASSSSNPAPTTMMGRLQAMREVERKLVEEFTAADPKPTLWMALHGKVLDVTTFVTMHPGGLKVILYYAGSDATGPFATIAHSRSAHTMIERFTIGELVP
ncbi:hypothetical protein CAOG_00355 [Capsaspora owczarzaki ATCC 30864]|uniref:Cytochrome b5 heme-binding domain-containing protein n=1 Tax=Capsaspora owczarzaki (strain ATCC 30864) TaxID=595528 RepID=A0A0D2WGY6_CAPO3|nr:hypothetical protein CAOG_00355 [Capsaspora owczarzaki ATCC 30864]KJE88765.1 hypothetical protein CAOG_000355 [Capsaspora owczarzaki ATCC 30864]|eukprot:XP_004365226.1 hypothetical protein CAOG_00355 [Capsaspora owczarzaki ATCC 30864]